jgi:hypothetical protein
LDHRIRGAPGSSDRRSGWSDSRSGGLRFGGHARGRTLRLLRGGALGFPFTLERFELRT